MLTWQKNDLIHEMNEISFIGLPLHTYTYQFTSFGVQTRKIMAVSRYIINSHIKFIATMSTLIIKFYLLAFHACYNWGEHPWPHPLLVSCAGADLTLCARDELQCCTSDFIDLEIINLRESFLGISLRREFEPRSSNPTVRITGQLRMCKTANVHWIML